jgi:ubiquitin C-terminal hydrolase
MTCTRCGGVSARFEPFTSLILPLAIDGVTSASTASLDSLIKELFKPEELSGIDCDYCKRKQIFNRTIDIWKLAPFLMLTLSRFSFDYRAVARKVTTFVDYPSETLPVEELVAREAPLEEFTDYELYAVIEHEGTVNRGHYTALVKTENGWISANDARVVRIVDESNVVNRNAYMLFYRWRVIGDKSDMFDLDDFLG